MRFEITDNQWGVQVEKVLDGGERYLIATYQDQGVAQAALSMIALSDEVKAGAVAEFGRFQV